MLSDITFSVIMLSDVKLNADILYCYAESSMPFVIMLSVVVLSVITPV
jgi:hypothetical protein